MLACFQPANQQLGDLFTTEQQDACSEALMQVVDKINSGRLGKVYFAARGQNRVKDDAGITKQTLPLR